MEQNGQVLFVVRPLGGAVTKKYNFEKHFFRHKTSGYVWMYVNSKGPEKMCNFSCFQINRLNESAGDISSCLKHFHSFIFHSFISFMCSNKFKEQINKICNHPSTRKNKN